MALSGTTLKTNIDSALQAAGFVYNDVSQLGALVDIIATEVVNHIKTAGVVSTTVTGTSQSGGSVTGTGTGTVS